jgi:hypothetical protein
MTVAKDAATNAGKTPEERSQRMRPDPEFSLRIWTPLRVLTNGFHPRGATQTGCFLALLLFAGVAIAQNPQAAALHATATEAPLALEKLPPAPPKISYVGGQLRIDAFGATLADVLTKVAAITGVNIEVPAGARNERMPVVELGPGLPRQVLASLLSDSTFDYLIQSSSTDPEKLQSVLLIPREKKGSGTNGTDGARPSRSAYARAAAQPEAPVPDSPLPPQPEVPALDAASLNSVPAAMQADSSTPLTSAQPEQSMLLPAAQPDPFALTRPGALAPPQTLNPQSINQQLQQMYQQRMQMIQPGGQIGQPAVR